MTNEMVDILLVEDNPQDAELTLHSLKKHGVSSRVHLARDGAEALAWLGDGSSPRPRIVVLDLKLPKVDGLEVLRRIRAEPRIRTLPVVVLSSSREERDLVECYKLGVNSYVVKPVQFEDFARAVADLGLYWILLNQAPPR